MGLFSNYISTKDPSRNKGGKQVIKVADSPFHVVNVIKEYLEKNGYTHISVQEEYNDIYAERFGYEVSIVVAASEAYSLIQLSVYDETKRWGIRSEFKKLYEDIETLFAGKISETK